MGTIHVSEMRLLSERTKEFEDCAYSPETLGNVQLNIVFADFFEDARIRGSRVEARDGRVTTNWQKSVSLPKLMDGIGVGKIGRETYSRAAAIAKRKNTTAQFRQR